MCQCGMMGLGDNGDFAGEYTGGQEVAGAGWDGVTGSGAYGGSYNNGVANTNWLNALTLGIKSATSILGTRYAVPQLNPGQLIQTGPNGQSLMYQGTAGNMSLPNINSMGVGSINPLYLGIGALALFFMMKKG